MSYYQKKYDELITFRRNNPINRTDSNAGEVEYHHIVPISCNGKDDRRIPENNHEGTNIIGLTCREHYVAHWLLVRIYQNTNFYYKMLHAFQMMCVTRNGKIKISSVAYAEAKRRLAAIPMKPTTKGKILVNDGVHQWYVFPDQVPENVSFGKIKSKNSRFGKIAVHQGRKTKYLEKGQSLDGYELGQSKGKIYVTDGKNDRVVFTDEIPEGFYKGKIGKPNQGKIYVNNGIKDLLVYPDQIPEGFQVGRLFNSSTKNKIRVNNGIIEKFVFPDEIEDGYKVGSLMKGKIIIVNDGQKDYRVPADSIPTGYVVGSIKRVNKGKIFVNNGIRDRMVYPDEIPEGYVKGRITRTVVSKK